MADLPGAKLPIGTGLNLLLAAARAVITGRVRVIPTRNMTRRVRAGFAKVGHLLLLLEQEGMIAPICGGWECLVPCDGLDVALERIRKTANA